MNFYFQYYAYYTRLKNTFKDVRTYRKIKNVQQMFSENRFLNIDEKIIRLIEF